MRAFVAGATGFTGREVVRQLAEAGHEVVAHIRPGSSSLETWGPRFEQLGASVSTTEWSDSSMAKTLSELTPELVFALLGTTRKRARGEGMDARTAYERVDYGLTALLIRAAANLSPPPRFIYLSSIGVREGVKNLYLAARARAEADLRASGLPFVIARPSFITGDRDDSRPAERVGAAISDGLLSVASAFGARRLRARYASLDNRELASALVAAALSDEHQGRVLAAEDLRPLIDSRP